MEPTIEDLRRNYERFDDDKLIRIATQDAARLRPDALELLLTIIKERGISEDVVRGLKARVELTGDDLDDYVELVRSIACPLCGSNAQPLNGVLVGQVISIVIMTTYDKELRIACPTCLEKELDNASITSGLLGWWGLPWGPVGTIQSFFFNAQMKKEAKQEQAAEALRGFVLKHIGTIEMHRNAPEELRQLIGSE